MVVRSLVGAVAVVTLLGTAAAVLPEHSASKPAEASRSEPIFGRLAPPQSSSPTQASPEQADAAHQTLLKLAAYTVPADPEPAAAAPVPQSAAPTAPTPRVDTAVATSPPPTPGAQTESHPASVYQALLTPQSAPEPATTRQARHQDGAVNINKAPVAVLDHLPGAGRIGDAIVRRRPYRSIEDLVSRRVLRKAALARIRPFITVD